jgi:hypothetical protein
MDELKLLVLIAPVDLKEELVDVLIGHADISGFPLTDAAGYSREHSHFNVQEQVAGYRSFCRFEILHEPDRFRALRAALDSACGNQAVRYWVGPVIEQGHLGGMPPRGP